MFEKVKCKKDIIDELYEDGRLAFVKGKVYEVDLDGDFVIAKNEQGVFNTVYRILSPLEKANYVCDDELTYWFNQHFEVMS